MKRLLIAPLLLTLLVASCSTKKKYNSYREANDACEKWVLEGGSYYKVYEEGSKLYPFTNEKISIPAVTYSITIRSCQDEDKSNQVLGLKALNVEENKEYYLGVCKDTFMKCDSRFSNEETEVIRYFSY